MSAEIICVGTELLLGDIVNTNVQYLAQQLAALGIPHYYQSVVGDNPERLKKVLALAVERSSLLILTGGLGPTPDDLTTAAIAEFFRTPLQENPQIVQELRAKFARLGRKMTPNNLKQALVPQGASILPNPSGTAPGIIWQPQPDTTIMTFPGVPSEMKRMWHETAVVYLSSQGWGKELIHSRVLKFRGIGESALASKIGELFNLTNPTIAPYASLGEVRLRLSAKASSLDAALALIAPVEEKIKHLTGEDCFGADEETLATVVGELLQDTKQTLAVAESCTGGGLGAMLTEIAGSSAYFCGGAITYANSAKVKLLGVQEEDLVSDGAVSATVAEQMALGIKNR
ncbi:MAG: competence/damage-inducible protein A, partial [Okeania sp. SIO2D1]|nr:competence/damage-inducible protein A [Okeania sp. SIO2D1]